MNCICVPSGCTQHQSNPLCDGGGTRLVRNIGPAGKLLQMRHVSGLYLSPHKHEVLDTTCQVWWLFYGTLPTVEVLYKDRFMASSKCRALWLSAVDEGESSKSPFGSSGVGVRALGTHWADMNISAKTVLPFRAWMKPRLLAWLASH